MRYTYLLADNGGVSNTESDMLLHIGNTFNHEYGFYRVVDYYNDCGAEVDPQECSQVYCERISQENNFM